MSLKKHSRRGDGANSSLTSVKGISVGLPEKVILPAFESTAALVSNEPVGVEVASPGPWNNLTVGVVVEPTCRN